MKLITVNVEYDLHFDTVLPFLEKEQADCVCLQEAPEHLLRELEQLGYRCSYAPMVKKRMNGKTFSAGVVIATRTNHIGHTHYFYRPQTEIVMEIESDREGTIAQPVLIATIHDPTGETYTIGTLHLVKSEKGFADDHQSQRATDLLAFLKKQQPLVLVGDFNMPRGYNSNYERFTAMFTDTIPRSYTSSLDKALYKKAKLDGSPIDQNIFTDYMVDYIFTQPPYRAENVRLEFGISDHAAVVAEIVWE